MGYWYFLFEGVFRDMSPKYGLKHTYSSAMVPEQNEEVAKKELIDALDSEGIDLLEINDKFLFNLENIDKNDADNRFWIDWYGEVAKTKKVIFTPWQVFDS